MEKLHSALRSRYEDEMPAGISDVLAVAYRQTTITYDEIKKIQPDGTEEILLFAWNRKFLIPRAFSRCSEWDDRILTMRVGEVYEMPNISRYLLKTATETGKWNISAAVANLFRDMGAAEWQRMPDLVDGITRNAVNYTISATTINAVCVKNGIKNKTGVMIAILKGGGIISPKLGAFGPVGKAGTPLYEVNPGIYPKPYDLLL